MSHENKQYVRLVLDALSNINDALNDAVIEIELDDIPKARIHLNEIKRSAELAIETLKPEET